MSYHEESTINVLKSVFGYEGFKNSAQRQAVTAICKGSNNTCICMPPGSGKSLCFQLPAVMQKGKVAIVFSPKLSIAKIEVEFLQSKQINARLLSPKVHRREKDAIIADLMSDSPKIVLLYCSPEMGTKLLFQNIVLKLRMQKTVSYLVFKDAHSLSEWGYDYVPCYKKIRSYNKIFGSISMIAVTTAATNKVIKDICQILCMTNPQIFISPIRRTNINYDVWFLETLSNPFEHLKNFIVGLLGILDTSIEEADKGVAIIYCREETTGAAIAQKLSALGVSAILYHYKLRKSVRENLEKEWESRQHSVIITTYSYGFIYRRPVRCIVHWTIPETIAKYYRESAEANRNQFAVHCRVYFGMKEYLSIKILIANHNVMNNTDHVMKRLKEFEKSASFCLTAKCRHKMISAHFGRESSSCRNTCDVCLDEDATEIRIRKFVAYSESVGRVKYKICDTNDDINNEENELNIVNISEKESFEKGFRPSDKSMRSNKSNLAMNGVVVVSPSSSINLVARERSPEKKIVKNLVATKHAQNTACMEPPNRQGVTQVPASSCSELNLVAPKQSSEEKILKNLVATKRARHSPNTDPSSIPAITQSWVNDSKSNNEVSPEPCASRQNTAKKLSAHRRQEKQPLRRTYKVEDCALESRHSGRYGVLNVRRMKRKPASDHFCEEAGIEESSSRAKKRRLSSDSPDSEDRKQHEAKRKRSAESKSINVPQINLARDIANENQRAKRVKDHASVGPTGDCSVVEYLMNKYRLDKDVITLIPKQASTKSKAESNDTTIKTDRPD